MGVISACLPSLRPLVGMLTRGTVRGLGVVGAGYGSGKSSNGSSTGSRSGGGRREKGRQGGGGGEFGSFSVPVTAQDAEGGQVGRVVMVSGPGARRGEEDEISLEAVNPAPGTIAVKDEIVVTSDDWLEYKDRIF